MLNKMEYMKTENLYLYGIAYNCPLHHRLQDCPVKQLVHLPFKERVVCINALSQEEKENILEHHKTCSIKR